MPPFASLQLRKFIHHYLHSVPPLPDPHFAPTHLPKLQVFPLLLLSNPFSSQTQDPVAQSLSTELLKDPSTDPLSVSQRLHLSFSHLISSNSITPSLVLHTLNLSPDAGRTVLGFHHWLVKEANFKHNDETISFFVDYFGRRKDFKATDELLVDVKGVVGSKTFESMVDRLVRAGRPTQVVAFFERMESDYGIKRDKESLRLVVKKLSENGFASYAEKMVKNLANEIFPDDGICNLLIKAWCVDGKLEEAKRLAGEMYRGGFEIGTTAFNAILECLCKICRDKDPFILDSEVEKVLMEMDVRGVPRDVETFNVLICNLCKIRRTEDAMKLFSRMGEWGCHGNETTYLALTRSLYKAARVGEGDEMIDKMKSAGYGDKLGKKDYYGFLKILCGIERLDHAISVFEIMKSDGCKPGVKTYDLLMGKWGARNRVDKANALFNEASSSGVPVVPKVYWCDPRFLKKPKAVKKEKRETFPEKMARKRRRLRQIKLSFVKKPKRRMLRGY